MNNLDRYKIYLVEWRDAWSSQETYRPDGDHRGLVSRNIGFLEEHTEDSIVLVSNITEDCKYGRNVFVIPQADIVKIEELI